MLIELSIGSSNIIETRVLELANFSHSGLYCSQRPICKTGEEIGTRRFIDQLFELENEVSGIEASDENEMILFSAKLARSRLYYVFYNQSLYLSDDLRRLLPFSSRKLSQWVAYGIVKFGEVPEHYSIIENVYSIPCGSFLKLKMTDILEPPDNGRFSEERFLKYFTIKYSLDGGEIEQTKNVLEGCLKKISHLDPILFVSGGVDSTLLNFIYSEVHQKPYPVVFIDFEVAPDELKYVQESIVNTHAELIPIRLSPSDLINDFIESVGHLIYPVYDNGSALAGYQIRKELKGHFGADFSFIDGTIADSCYGVRNYNSPLITGRHQSPLITSFKEWVYMQVLLHDWPWPKTRPRDSFLNDEFLQDLLWNAGPYANFWVNDSENYTVRLKGEYHKYFDYIDMDGIRDYWSEYTVLKMMLYAAKQTTIKTYDMLLPAQAYFPFMFRSVLEDQGKYSWEQKSKGDVPKAPLKSILERFIDKDFVYRKKVGLQSQTRQWIYSEKVKPFFINFLQKKGSIVESLLGANQKKLVAAYSKGNRSVAGITLSLIVIQMWMDVHNISVE